MQGNPLIYPTSARLKYQQAIDKLIAPMTAEYEREIKKIYKAFGVMDASISSQFRILLNALSAKWQARFTKAGKSIVDKMLYRVEAAANNNLNASLKELSGGIAISPPKLPAGLADNLTASIAENTALIKSIPAQYASRIHSVIMASLQSGGTGAGDIFKVIKEIGLSTDKRAKLIARDQTTKITATINAERAKAVGIKKFIWRHSKGGSEPRPLHLKLDGEIFSYDDLPVIDERTGQRGLPGVLINCRCQAIPVLDFGEQVNG